MLGDLLMLFLTVLLRATLSPMATRLRLALCLVSGTLPLPVLDTPVKEKGEWVKPRNDNRSMQKASICCYISFYIVKVKTPSNSAALLRIKYYYLDLSVSLIRFYYSCLYKVKLY